MINNKKILAIITARGGSKGVKGKNIKSLNGIPLIGYSINACKGSKYIDKVILSSDDKEIIKVAEEAGVSVPFVRPSELATDTATSVSVIKHAAGFMESNGESYDYIITIQPTSPFRTSNHLDGAIEAIANDANADSLVSITEVDYNPYWMKVVKGGYIESFMEVDEKKFTRRQDLPKVYKMNGSIFISKRDLIMEGEKILGEKVVPFFMSSNDSVDIDNEEDFALAEFLMRKEI
ncbi:acylneuraminate cytidylyltransferase family protein [Clostridium sp. SHJSY1]|uniref:acylneuraminate cytidylyltransferase family protein n=1 Tax=Clostridium sp. SHJSY1 TaxID=2942483 RepID=UPI00287619C8|nr:acylneuraminate cytidylyltransferase family protein [Clostridium sp. SHJSY1]MDS0526639.1 acylneuraminate cytidylyltransferase family protein [Clostridium sp. SHJSY1]